MMSNDVHDNETSMAILPGSIAVSTSTSVEANSMHGNHIEIAEQGNFTRCNGNNIRPNHNGNPPQGACASTDNQLPYIQLLRSSRLLGSQRRSLFPYHAEDAIGSAVAQPVRAWPCCHIPLAAPVIEPEDECSCGVI